MSTPIIFYSTAFIALALSWFADKTKTKKALKKAYMSLKKLLPAIIPMILFVGVILTIVSPEVISRLMGAESGIVGIFLGLGLGSVIFMPSFVTFSLGANLLDAGAGYAQVGALVSTLMAVGISSLTIELKYFDKKLTIMRNVMAFIASGIFVILIGMVM